MSQDTDTASRSECRHSHLSSMTSSEWCHLQECCGSGIRCFLTPRSRIRDGRNPDLRSGINISDHISKSLVTIFGLKNTLVLFCGSGSGIQYLFDPGFGTEKFGSETNIPYPATVISFSIFKQSTGEYELSRNRVIVPC
jgi:hypothetical protein